MREIKFRGMHIHVFKPNEHLNGSWVYGYLTDKNYIYSPKLEGEMLVDPKTVGQYTGLDDIKKQNVYGGDLLEDGAEKIWEMKFGTHTRIIPLGPSKRIKLVGHGWFLESIDNGDVVPATECQYIKVIGNIYENKDLLKEEE